MKKKNASTIIYLIFFLVVFLAFCSFAVDATIIFTDRTKLQNATESAALAAASAFNKSENVTIQDIENEAEGVFDRLKFPSLKYATWHRDAPGQIPSG